MGFILRIAIHVILRYLDKRGDSTDVQYIGKQHVYYHNSTPRLVKQWRKEDFADQYFTMSMQENVLEDGIHWPLILNVPGEGFGDDFLQKYTEHFLLTDEDDALFLLDQAFIAANGTCEEIGGGGEGGPPVGEVEPIPSNLVVEDEAWFTNEVTFSPIWEPPAAVTDGASNLWGGSNGPYTTPTDFGLATTCYNSVTGTVDVSFSFTEILAETEEDFPWVAIGYRRTEECLMTPRGGGDSEIIFVGSSDFGISASLGSLSPNAKRFDAEAFASLLSSQVPLEEAENFSNHELLLPFGARATKSNTDDDSFMSLRFSQTMEKPEVMYMMFAIGSSPAIGYHSSRGCFELTEFPDCETNEATDSEILQTNIAESGAVSLVSGIGAFLAVILVWSVGF